jgi:nucleoporin GLE1
MESPTSGDDDLASRLRGTHMGSGRYDFEIRFENRNSEDVHKDALAAAHAEHTRVREFALRAFELNELREQQLRLQQKNEQEAERVRLEELRAAEAIKARELENKARSIPKPPPRVPTPPPPAPSQVAASTKEQPKPATQPTSDTPKPATQSTPVAPRPQVPAPQPHPSTQASAPKPDPTQSNPLQQQLTLSPPVSQAQPQQKPTPVPQPQPTSPSNNSSLSSTHPDAERYLEVHRSLKQLRKFINDAGKANPALKKKTGEMRRAIRQSMGQLTGEKGANKEPVCTSCSPFKNRT